MVSFMRRVFGLCLFLLSFLGAPVVAQENIWRAIDSPNRGALICPVASPGSVFCLAAMCTGEEAVLNIVNKGGTPLAGDRVLRVTVDGRLSFLIPLMDVSAEGQTGYGAPLYDGEGSRMVDALISGSRAEIALDTEAGEIRHSLSLRGSARALRPVLRACPNRDPAFDPSDVPVTAPTPRTTPDNPIDRTFLQNNCVATESDLYTAVERQYGPGNGQPVMRIWSTSPTFDQNYEVIARDPFTYRWTSGPCADQAAAPAVQQTPSAGAQTPPGFVDQGSARVQAMLTDACQSRGGELDHAGMRVTDLDGDGTVDLLFDEGFVTCKGAQSRSINCGMQVCSMHVFLWRDGGLRRAGLWLNGFGGLTDDTPPGIEIISHGGATGVMRWNGQGFVAD